MNRRLMLLPSLAVACRAAISLQCIFLLSCWPATGRPTPTLESRFRTSTARNDRFGTRLYLRRRR